MTEQEEDSLCLQALEENDFFQDEFNDLLAHALDQWDREQGTKNYITKRKGVA